MSATLITVRNQKSKIAHTQPEI